MVEGSGVGRALGSTGVGFTAGVALGTSIGARGVAVASDELGLTAPLGRDVLVVAEGLLPACGWMSSSGNPTATRATTAASEAAAINVERRHRLIRTGPA
jgi:hypothetical protein